MNNQRFARPTELTVTIVELLESNPEGLMTWEIQDRFPGRRVRSSLTYLRRRGTVEVKVEQRVSIRWERYLLAGKAEKPRFPFEPQPPQPHEPQDIPDDLEEVR